MPEINVIGGGHFPSLTSTGVSSTDGTTSPAGGTSSVTLDASSGYDAILSIASGFELLGLTAPLSSADTGAALGEISQDLEQALAQNQELSDADSSYLTQMLQYLSQLQTAQAAQQAAQNQAQQDSSTIATNTTSINSMTSTINTNGATILSDTLSMNALVAGGASPDSDQVSQLQGQITSLSQTDTQLSQSISSLQAQNVSLQADIGNQNQIMANEQTAETNVYAGIAQTSEQFVAPAGSSGSQTGADPLSELLSLVENLPNETLQADLHVAQTDNLIQNNLDSSTQAALSLIASVGAVLAAMASLGVLAPQDGNAPPAVSGAAIVA